MNGGETCRRKRIGRLPGWGAAADAPEKAGNQEAGKQEKAECGKISHKTGDEFGRLVLFRAQPHAEEICRGGGAWGVRGQGRGICPARFFAGRKQ